MLFYLNFVGAKGQRKDWVYFQRTHEYENWSGRTFELLCSRHVAQIKDAFRLSKNHKPSHSLLLVMVTTMGLGNASHNRVVNAEVTLEDLFREL